MALVPFIQMELCVLKTLGEMVCVQPVVKFRDADYWVIELFK
jgi:hypothetical protein